MTATGAIGRGLAASRRNTDVRHHRLSVALLAVLRPRRHGRIRTSQYQQMAHGKMSYRPTHTGGVVEEKNARADIKMAGARRDR